MTHNRRARAAPTRLELPNYSHGPSRACLCSLLKDFRGVFEGLPHPQASGIPTNAQARSAWASRPPRPDSVGALRPNSQAARRGDFFPFLPYVPLGVNRPDQRIANESGDQEAGKNIKDQVVDMIARNALGHARVMQVIDDQRVHGSSPCALTIKIKGLGSKREPWIQP